MSYLFYGRQANNSCYSHCFRAPLYRLRSYNRDDRHYSTLIMLRDFRFFLLAFCSLCPFIIHTSSFKCFYYFARDLQNRRTTTIDQNWERFLGRPERFLFFHRFFFCLPSPPHSYCCTAYMLSPPSTPSYVYYGYSSIRHPTKANNSGAFELDAFPAEKEG